MKVLSILCGFLITIFGTVIGYKVPDIKFTNITINSTPANLYYDNCSSKLSESGDTVSVGCSIKEDLPEDMMVRVIAEVNGEKIVSVDVTVCEAFEEGLADQNFLDHGYPKDRFPKSCPIKAGDIGVRDYTFSSDNIPFEVPAGNFIVKYVIYELNNEPYVTLSLEGLITYK